MATAMVLLLLQRVKRICKVTKIEFETFKHESQVEKWKNLGRADIERNEKSHAAALLGQHASIEARKIVLDIIKYS